MLPNLIHKTTIALALTLIGLVGGIGTGLHWIFGCSHHCHCSDSGRTCYSASSANTPCSSDHCCAACCQRDSDVDLGQKKHLDLSQSPDGILTESDHDCAICQLLSQFNSSSIESTSLHVVWGHRDSIAISLPEVDADSTHRLEHPRGPPLWYS